ncbi:MAG: prepilin-type N-terminal cleavage/methylation domain-containing protein [Gemmataceae bacterium]
MANSRRDGVSLVEVLVVTAVVAVLVGLLLGAVQRVRERAAAVRLMNDLRQVSLAAHNFAAAKGGRLLNVDGGPPNRAWPRSSPWGRTPARRPNRCTAWEAALLLRARGLTPPSRAARRRLVSGNLPDDQMQDVRGPACRWP